MPTTDTRARARGGVLTAAAIVASTVALLAVRASLDTTHVALAYLLVVLGVSAVRGRLAGLATSVLAFLCFNFFFLAPYYTLTVADPIEWAVLAAFLVTSLVAAQLLARARSEAASARLRAAEIERLSTLGAESLNAARADDALVAIAEVIRSTLEARTCEIHVHEPDHTVTLVARSGAPAPPVSRHAGLPAIENIVPWVAQHGRLAAELHTGTFNVGRPAEGIATLAPELHDARLLVFPLHVRTRTVGVLTLVPERPLTLDAAQTRFLEALSYYAALGVERLRLTREADRAEALAKADEAKNAVLASVSHDLRTPLTTIKALAHEIGRDGDDRALMIEEEADRLNRFVADLLDLSRLTAGAVHVEPVINAAEDLVGAVLQRVSGAVSEHRLEASVDPGEPVLLARFDFGSAVRVVANLVENALKFAPPGSTVELHARRAGESVEFVVADRGPGVPDNEREGIFEPFRRPDGAARDGRGAGLGLSIARGLARAQGGSVRHEPREGGGSRFIFSVPAAAVSELDESLPSL